MPTTNKLQPFQLPSQVHLVNSSTDQPGLPNLNTPPLPRGRLGHGKGYVAPRWAAPTPDVRRLFTLLFLRRLLLRNLFSGHQSLSDVWLILRIARHGHRIGLNILLLRSRFPLLRTVDEAVRRITTSGGRVTRPPSAYRDAPLSLGRRHQLLPVLSGMERGRCPRRAMWPLEPVMEMDGRSFGCRRR